MNYKTLTTLFVLFLTILLVPKISLATIIFQNNFDNSPDTHTGFIVPPGWEDWYFSGAIQGTIGEITHWSGEINSPGRGGSGKSLKMWRAGTLFDDYTGALYAGLSSHFNPTTNNIYIRWAMKLPSSITVDFSNAGSNYQKLWRLNTDGGNGEIYLNINAVNGNFFPQNAALQISTCDVFYDPNLGYNTVHVTLLPPSEMSLLFDNQWHSYEIHIGTATNIIEFWLDGVLKFQKTNHPMVSQNVIFIQHFGMGNRASGSIMQDSWQSWEFDDLVIADSYIGPVTLPSDNTSPSTPINLIATTISSSQIDLSWTASIDNVSVTGYKIYRCQGSGCTPSIQVATSSTTSYSDTNLSANTTYIYRVAAYDNAGNVSSYSNSASATTLINPINIFLVKTLRHKFRL